MISRPQSESAAPAHPWAPEPAAAFPQMYMLGNGRLGTWISDAGGGALWWHQQALTRWLPDATRDNHGLWIYVRDEASNAIWSIGRQPTGVAPDDAQVAFHPHMAEFRRRDHGVAIRMEVGVAVGDDLEIRRLTIANETDRVRTLQVTSYGEVVLAPALDDERHPAFSKLFVGSEYLSSLNGLLFARRPRDPKERPPVLLHRVLLDGLDPVMVTHETDRRAFLGRSGSLQAPRGVIEGLSGATGWTLDPVMAFQLRLELAPQQTRQLAFVTIAGESHELALQCAERYATLAALDGALSAAGREAALELQRLKLDPKHLPHIQVLASLLLAPQPALRAASADLLANRLGQPRLWALGLSGDLPILLLRLGHSRDVELLRVPIRAHELWRRRMFQTDLVILVTGGGEAMMRERVLTEVSAAGAQEHLGQRGGIHLVAAEQIAGEDKRLLECTACVVLDVSRGPLERQLAGVYERRPQSPTFKVAAAALPQPTEPIARPADLRFDNGLGGFSKDGNEYVIHLEPGDRTPAPWCNILANEDFGALVSEAGLGCTWAANSGENRLSPWTNDPVADPSGEVLYLRDEESGEVWTPTSSPAGGAACQIRHGAGYTRWLTRSHGFEQELTVFVPADAPLKVARLRLRNLLPAKRRITATYYVEWLLGAVRSVSRRHVVCEYDAAGHTLLARNPWNPEFAERVAFLTASHPPHSLTTDRSDFLGRDGDPSRPAGLLHRDLGNRIEPGSDPCAAYQACLDIAGGDATDVVFVLGQEWDRAHAMDLAQQWRDLGRVDGAFEALRAYWDRQLGAMQVRTPDLCFDLMLNRWLMYQTLASRILARAGFYQAGGAFGFRDQLQDVLAFLHTDPARTRAHILNCAARQFEEGDVLHWWHPPHGPGVRTRCSDDLLWLPYVTSRYVEATGDVSILSEDVPFLRAAELSLEEDDRYGLFETGPESGSLFEHCARALERGSTRGQHQLPLIGSCDWNDGMNRVGRHGRGESVWLAWFLIATMTSCARLAARLDREDLAERWTRQAEDFRLAVERAGWDGEWYLRAFDDEGYAWGSAACEECRIDSIAQSWAVLAGAREPERARMAVEAAARELIRVNDRLICLLWPPFHETPRDPGYIKAYPPGIRENGGQYTHAAAWLGLAFVRLGDGDRAWRIFDLINPIRRTSSRAEAEHYRREPYVLAADIASVAPHAGLGGWTWYSGAAAWTWRLGLEGILGLQRRDGRLVIDPCLPKAWGSAYAEIKGATGTLAVQIEDPEHLGRGLVDMTVDGAAVEGATVAFPADGAVRRIRVRLRRQPA